MGPAVPALVVQVLVELALLVVELVEVAVASAEAGHNLDVGVVVAP